MDRTRVRAAIRRAEELVEETRYVMHATRNERYLAALLREASMRERTGRSKSRTLARMLGHEDLPLRP